MKKSLVTVLAAALLPWAAVASEQPSDFKWRIAIQTDGGNAIYQLDLPAAVYRGAFRRDAGDLRVFNAAEEVVPHAFRPRATTTAEVRAPVSLQPFALRGEDKGSLDNLRVRLEQSGGRTIFKLDAGKPAGSAPKLLAYLVDVSAVDAPIQALLFQVNAHGSYAGKVAIEASHDLARWRMIKLDAPLVRLEQAAAVLEQRRVEAPVGKTKYLRISWTGLPADAELTGLQAELGDSRVDVERQWTTAEGLSGSGKAGEYGFDSQGHFPVDRLKLALPQVNTVAQVEILSRNRSQDNWRQVARGTAYRLRHEGREIASPDFVFSTNADRYWVLRVDQKGGGLGAGEARLDLGWLPERLVFVARGAAPFTLAFGSRTVQPSAFGMEALVPGYRRDADLGAANAKVADLLPADARPVAPEADAEAVRAPTSDPVDYKNWILWATLVAGVLALGWMAWRLMRQMGDAENRPPGA